jgi:hypothetical protein
VTGPGPYRDPAEAAAQRARELRAEVDGLEAELALVRSRRRELEVCLRRQLGGQLWPAAVVGFVIGFGLTVAGWAVAVWRMLR